MGTINSLDSLLYTAVGALLFWLGSVVKDWISRSTKDRREEVNRTAKLELRNRLLTESLYEHRTVMLKSGQWTRDTLPPFIKEN